MPFTVFSKGLTATEYIEKIASDNGGNPNKSCVIGETSLAYVNPYYNDNLDVLRLAFGNDLSYCTYEGTYYVCNMFYVDSNGCVGANNGSWYCDFYYDGNSACFE